MKYLTKEIRNRKPRNMAIDILIKYQRTGRIKSRENNL